VKRKVFGMTSKWKLLLLAALCLCVKSVEGNHICMNSIENDDTSFEEYLVEYEIEVPDEATRIEYRNQFYTTKREIEEFNGRPTTTYKQSINKFAHLHFEDVQKKLGLSLMRYSYPPRAVEEKLFEPECTIAPIDWRKKKAVTPV
jgi:hypothetical protein